MLALSSSSPTAIPLSASSLPFAQGQSTATFSYTALAAGSSVVGASAPGYQSSSTEVTAFLPNPPSSLREAAGARGLLIGAAADADEFGYPDPLVLDPTYGLVLGSEYNMLEPENAMKWDVVHPQEGTYDFQPGDELVAFAQKHQLQVRGHNLCWNLDNPSWLTNLSSAPPATLFALLHDHISAEVSHYKGQVFAWDVVNEAVDDNASGTGTQMKDSIWYNQPGIGLSGTGYVEQAFRWAHEADPAALLFYNEYNIYEPGPKFQAVYNMVSDFVRRGVPIHGIGFQMHLGLDGYPTTEGITETMQAFTSLGLQVHITEMDVKLPVDASGAATSADLEAQADIYKRVLQACLGNPGCTGFQTWGFTDKHSWIPASEPGFGAALPFDMEYQPKPAYTSLLQALTTASTIGVTSSAKRGEGGRGLLHERP